VGSFHSFCVMTLVDISLFLTFQTLSCYGSQGMLVQSGFIWLRTRSSGGLLLILQRNNVVIFRYVIVYSSFSQTMGCDLYLGSETVLSGSQNNSMNLFITNSRNRTALISALKGSIFVNVITFSDIVTMSAWLSCKKWHTPLTLFFVLKLSYG
jgi:hypothetical protein